jgi:hypothetical protein
MLQLSARHFSWSPKPVAPVTQNARSIPIRDDLKPTRASWRFAIASGNLNFEFAVQGEAFGASDLQHSEQSPQNSFGCATMALPPGSRRSLRYKHVAFTGQ